MIPALRDRLVLALITGVAIFLVGAVAWGSVVASKDSAARPAAMMSGDCGLDLGTREPADVPSFLRFSGGEVVAVKRARGFLSVSLNVPMTVREVMETVRARLPASRYRELHHDYEGFEAEVFLGSKRRIGVVRVLKSGCDAWSRTLFQVSAGK